MILLALVLALAQQDGQPTPHDQTGVSQPSAKGERPEESTSGNVSEKAEPLSKTHPTELQGNPPAKKQRGKRARSTASAKPLPPAQTPSGAEETDKHERQGGKGKASEQPKPIGEKSDQ